MHPKKVSFGALVSSVGVLSWEEKNLQVKGYLFFLLPMGFELYLRIGNDLIKVATFCVLL